MIMMRLNLHWNARSHRPPRPCAALVGAWTFLAALTLLTCASAPTAVQAQVYRIVGPDGKVTFSDRPPDAAASSAAPTSSTAPASSAASTATATANTAALPYELRQLATRYPVTLYTSDDCTPCVSVRQWLVQRGIPFTERSISTPEDVQALKNLSGQTGLPLGTIGGQRLQGFSESEWAQYLDLAGYPQQSRLPRSYRYPAATPLVPRAQKPPPTQSASPEEAAAPTPRPASPPPPPTYNPRNPAGIVF